MVEDVMRKISDEDWRLIEANQLGVPIGIYRLRQGYISLFRWGGLGAIFVGLGILLLASIHAFDLVGTSFYPWGIGVLSLIGGISLLLISLVQLPKERVLVCEDGLLQVANTRTTAVRWHEIRAIREDFFPFRKAALVLPRGKELILQGYQHLDELITLIKQRSGLA
jgi:hypothetical protein